MRYVPHRRRLYICQELVKRGGRNTREGRELTSGRRSDGRCAAASGDALRTGDAARMPCRAQQEHVPLHVSGAAGTWWCTTERVRAAMKGKPSQTSQCGESIAKQKRRPHNSQARAQTPDVRR